MRSDGRSFDGVIEMESCGKSVIASVRDSEERSARGVEGSKECSAMSQPVFAAYISLNVGCGAWPGACVKPNLRHRTGLATAELRATGAEPHHGLDG